MTLAALLYRVAAELVWQRALERPGSGRTGGSVVFGGMLILFYSILGIHGQPQLSRACASSAWACGTIFWARWWALSGRCWPSACSCWCWIFGRDYRGRARSCRFVGDLLRTSLLIKVFPPVLSTCRWRRCGCCSQRPAGNLAVLSRAKSSIAWCVWIDGGRAACFSPVCFRTSQDREVWSESC